MSERKKYSPDDLYTIFWNQDGRCHLCDGRLILGAYGQKDNPRGWEVEHGKPLSRGGGETLHNLRPACIKCNRMKGGQTTSEYRRSRDDEGRRRTNPALDELKYYVDYHVHKSKMQKFVRGTCHFCGKNLEMELFDKRGKNGWRYLKSPGGTVVMICNKCQK
jgi:hypothetical protein